MNSTEIATAAVTANLTLVIVASAYGWHLVARFADGAEVETGLYDSEAKARAAANREWTRIRKAEALAA